MLGQQHWGNYGPVEVDTAASLLAKARARLAEVDRTISGMDGLRAEAEKLRRMIAALEATNA